MTSKEFVLWLKGFTEGVHEFNINPKQWDILKDKLAEVKDEEPIGFPFGVPNTQTVVTTTPGGGSITYAKPQFVTSTTYGYPSGSSISYTSNNED